MVKYYEEILLLRPDISQDGVVSFFKEVHKFVESMDGNVISVEDWGMRSMSYPIKKSRKAYYYMIFFSIIPQNVNLLKDFFTHNGDVLRFMIVAVDNDTYEPSRMMHKDITSHILDGTA